MSDCVPSTSYCHRRCQMQVVSCAAPLIRMEMAPLITRIFGPQGEFNLVFACLLTMFLFLPLHAMADLTFLAHPANDFRLGYTQMNNLGYIKEKNTNKSFKIWPPCVLSDYYIVFEAWCNVSHNNVSKSSLGP